MTDEAQPSSTEPVDNPQWTPEQLAAIQAKGIVPVQINHIEKAETASVDPNASAPSPHTHESLLRRIHDVLTAKFAGLDHELNHLLAEARKIL